jgi:Di-haem oxidoreductase, putative peroxidase
MGCLRSMLLNMAGLSCLFLITVGIAHAGPSNRGVRPSQLNPSEGLGSPLPAVMQNSSDLQVFITGQANFKEEDKVPELGPIFNGHTSCAGCHFQGAIGGGASINEVRVELNKQAGPLHLFAVDNSNFQELPTFSPGCSLEDPACQLSFCQEKEATITGYRTDLPDCDPSSSSFISGSDCQAHRQTLPLFGDGLVEAVDDEFLENLAENEPNAVRGSVKLVSDNNANRVGRFGWKDDHATLRGFASDAYLNEMGITNPDHPEEVSECALKDPGLETPPADEPEDPTDADGRADIDRFADFMRGLNPPLPEPSSIPLRRGARLFAAVGCADCHTPALTTSSNPAAFIPTTTGGLPISNSLNQALANQTFHPFSDFLLHDMGSLGDGITSGSAGPTMMRTAPLWGISVRTTFLHDGRAKSVSSAIALHDGQGKPAAEAFSRLESDDQQELLDFVESR